MTSSFLGGFALRLNLVRQAALALACGLGVLTGAAHAADWPKDRAISLIVPYPAGSSPDILARTIAEPLSKALAQNIVIENRPGAGGNIGTRAATRAAADGYTLLYTINGPLVTAPTLYKKTLGYDPFKDLTPVSLVATSPNVLTVPAAGAGKSVAEFVELARQHGTRWNYGSVGPGSSSHLAMEMFKERADIDLLQIPYAGFPQIITAIMAGDIQAGFMVPAIAMPQVRQGKARALAITSLEPSEALPGIPTMADQGYPGFESISWNAVLAPRGTPPAIVARLNSEIATALKNEKVQQVMRTQYFTPAPTSPEGLTRLMTDEKARWDKVIDTLGLSLD